jgi:8-oxo-dGTP diphosphatase
VIFRRKTYKVKPEQVETFNEFFHEYLLPNQLKHGAHLVGRFVSVMQDEIVALWAYPNMEAYQKVEAEVTADDMHVRAQARRKELGSLFETSAQDFLLPTGNYHTPQHIVAVAGLIRNDAGQVLLVRTAWRNDTWELPGGQVEEGESPDSALMRELMEETGIDVELDGVSFVQYNASRGLLSLTFRGRSRGGVLRPSSETPDVGFFDLNEHNAAEFITRAHFLRRFVEANRNPLIPLDSF